MFDTKSDFALNKLDQKAIVCKSTTGVHIRLTQEVFSSEDEFKYWKKWSDGDYKDTERAGRDFYDNCVSLSEESVSLGTSAEDALFAPLLESEQRKERNALLQKVRSALTEKQYRRLHKYFLEGMTEAEIAKIEGVGQRRISTSISSGIAVLKKILKNF